MFVGVLDKMDIKMAMAIILVMAMETAMAMDTYSLDSKLMFASIIVFNLITHGNIVNMLMSTKTCLRNGANVVSCPNGPS